MSNIKIGVYTICKNEEKFVNTWCDNILGFADYVCVLDTGSTDKTVELFKSRGINIQQEVITPWRFDIARNLSLDMLPDDTDVFICLDLDEILSPGWAEKIREQYRSDVNNYRYKYVWNFNADGSEGIVYLGEKIHGKGFRWKYPVHEILYNPTVPVLLSKELDIVIEHHADNTKSRSSYLPLLKLSFEENPEDDRTAHYLGREYYFYKFYEEAIETLKIHLSMKSSKWPAERSASMRYIAKSYMKIGDINNALFWFEKAIIEAPEYREPFVDIIKLLYTLKDWDEVIYFSRKALCIVDKKMEYLCEPFVWGSYLDDVLSIALWEKGYKVEAKKHCMAAILLDKNNTRLMENLKFMEDHSK